jgi:hypothetical protein
MDARQTKIGFRVIPWLTSSAALVLGLALHSTALADGSWTPGPDAVDTGTPFIQGYIDSPAPGMNVPPGSALHVSGWIVDQTAQGWAGFDQLNVYQGKAGEGGTLLAQGTVGESRPDVAAATGNPSWVNSGFDATVPASAVPSGPATLGVYAHSPAKGWWYQQVPINGSGAAAEAPSGLVINVIAPGPNESIVNTGDYVIRGAAYDTRTSANTGVGVDRVQVYLDGLRGVAGSHSLGEAYPDAQTLWSVTFHPTQFDKVVHHWMYVYARSAVTGEEQILAREFNIVHK